MRRRTIRLINCLRSVALPTGAFVLVLLLPGSLEAQAKPATLADVIQLLESGVPGARVVLLTEQSCRAFEVDDAAERDLRSAGADSGLLQSLRGVCYRAPEPTPEERQRERHRAAQAERDRQARLAAERKARAERRELAESVALLSPEVLLRLDRLGYRPVRSLLREKFSANTLGWTGSRADTTFSIHGGRAYIGRNSSVIRRTHDDVAIRFDLRYESGYGVDEEAGVSLRRTTGLPYIDFAFEASGDVRRYNVHTHHPEWRVLVPWTGADELIRTGENTVELIVTGNSFSLFLNGMFVRSGAGVPSRKGELIRLYAQNSLYSFDNLVVVALEPK